MLLVSVDKKKVLNHHPDKRRARGLAVKDGEDDYFTCITRGNFVHILKCVLNFQTHCLLVLLLLLLILLVIIVIIILQFSV